MLRFLGVFFLCLILVKLTTFGFRPSKKYIIDNIVSMEEFAQGPKDTIAYLSLNIGNRNYRDYENLNKTKEYIQSRFEDMGYAVELQDFKVGGKVFSNVIAYKPSVSKGGVVIIGAHYDTCFNPGADDNASGVAGLLELARLLRDEESKRQIKFIAFVNEEPLFFMTENMGSRVYAKRAKSEKEDIKAVVILEMIGFFSDTPFSQRYLPLLGMFYPNRGNFIAIVGNFYSRNIVADLALSYQQGAAVPLETLLAPSFVPGVNFSDHWSFWKDGFKAVMVTDTGYLRYPHYHRQSDLPKELDFVRMNLFLHHFKKSVLELAGK
ncbi:MAG: hypothetical protein A2Z88_08210 [Omnitrophica WOR_2 bacterium GWA2_47_8]|nr:MAG: hypothetical protein A2Z88_08210 [Omnitrophica WOR_2 bacterium GWA2_47_8]